MRGTVMCQNWWVYKWFGVQWETHEKSCLTHNHHKFFTAAWYVQSGEFLWSIKFWNHYPPQSMTHDKIEKADVIDCAINFMKMWIQIDLQTKFHGTTKFCTNTFQKNHRRKSIGDKKKIYLLIQEMMHWSVHQIEGAWM